MLTRTDLGAPVVTAADAAEFMRVTEASELPLIELLVESATTYCEAVTGRDVRASSYRLALDDFPSGSWPICLPMAGVSSVTEVSRRVDGVYVPFPEAGNWYLVTPSLYRAEVWLEQGKVWPSDADARKQAVRVDFVTGDNPHVPVCVEGIKRHVAAMYADRGDSEFARGTGGVSGGADSTLVVDTARSSGAVALYAPVSLPSV